jgi:rare lipoprotein A
MFIFDKKQHVLKPIHLIRVTVLFAAILILLAIRAVAVHAAESSMKIVPVKPNQESVTALNITAVNPAPAIVPVAAGVTKKVRAINMMSGNASWYGSVLQGHKTASGEIFDDAHLTAAHRTLPFGTMVRVTDLRNQRSVIVKITDRGTLFADRAIDLSYAAAQQLNMLRDGVHPVRLTVIPKNDPSLASWIPEPAASSEAATTKAE